MEYYKVLDIYDLPDETWVDCFEHEGYYEISNFGRVKRLEREILSKWGTIYNIPEIIMKPAISYVGNSKKLIISLKSLERKSYNLAKLVFRSFYPNENFNNNDIIIHLNKNTLDNRIINLKKGTRKESKIIDIKKSKLVINATLKNIKKACIINSQKYKNCNSKICSICNVEKSFNNFPKQSRWCYECIRKKDAIRRLKNKQNG